MLLLFLFIAVPLIEIALFVQLGSVLDLGWILLIVVLTAILGTWIVRRQGRDVLRQIQGAFEQMRDPTEAMAHGAMVLFSGALLLTPGFFTDAIGFLLLIPAVRSFVFNKLQARVAATAQQGGRVHVRTRAYRAGPTTGRSGPGATGDVIEGEFTDVSDEPSPRRDGPSGWTKGG